MKTNTKFVTGIVLGILAIVAMGAALAPDAIWNAIYDSTEEAIQVSIVKDSFSNNVEIGGTLAVTGTTTLTGAAAANGGFSVDSPAFTVANTSGNVSTTGTLAVTGTTTLTGALTANGGISADGGAFSVADTSGNVATTGTLTVGGASSLKGAVVINEDSADVDTRIESNGNANAIVVNAGDDRVGIFTAAPTVPFDVTGQSLFTGAFGVVGAVTVTGDSVLDGGLIVNEASADKDVRIETNDVSDAFVVDGGANFVQVGTWAKYDYITTTAESYSLASTGRASNIIQTVDGEDGTLHLMTELLTSPGAGAVITIKTGNTQTVTIDTEGAETIDGGATYALDGNYEAVTLTTDGSNWFILGGYLE